MAKSPETEHPVQAFGYAASDTSGILSPFKFSRRYILFFFCLIFYVDEVGSFRVLIILKSLEFRTSIRAEYCKTYYSAINVYETYVALLCFVEHIRNFLELWTMKHYFACGT